MLLSPTLSMEHAESGNDRDITVPQSVLTKVAPPRHATLHTNKETK